MTDNTTLTTHATDQLESPRIYVACLAAYNHGILHGTWLDATLEPEAIMDATQAMLKTSPIAGAEEHAIHDYEGFYNFELSEYEDFTEVHEYANFLQEYGQIGALLLTYVECDVRIAEAMMKDGYCGGYRSLAGFAQEITEDTIEIPEELRYYIDYQAMALDMESNGEIITFEIAHDEVHIFWHR